MFSEDDPEAASVVAIEEGFEHKKLVVCSSVPDAAEAIRVTARRMTRRDLRFENDFIVVIGRFVDLAAGGDNFL